MNEKIVILDYGVGNLVSIKNMLKSCGVDAVITNDPGMVAAGHKYILPGVGAFDYGISNLRSAPYFSILESRVLKEKVPVLGVCLGAQLLAGSSEEGALPGLNWIPGKVIRFGKERMSEHNLKVPHMGWSEVNIKKSSRLFEKMPDSPRFYFVHSYHWVCERWQDELITSVYGYEFTAGVERENIIGVQFHPEKSHKFGRKLYENFAKLY